MPRRRLPVLTYLGTGSMYIYVIHALLVDGTGFRETAWYHGIDTVPEMLGLMGLAVVGALALGSPPVRWVARWLIQPRYSWPFRDEVPETPPLGKVRA
ncbi:MAG: acyltransferase [Actinomycetales bacterium]|nr:acyltransferase [Actinomycetales bacterium]